MLRFVGFPSLEEWIRIELEDLILLSPVEIVELASRLAPQELQGFFPTSEKVAMQLGARR